MEIAITNRFHISIQKDTMLKPLLYVVWASMLHMFLRGLFNRIPIFQDNVEIALIIYFTIPVLLALPILINKFSLGDYLFFIFIICHLLSGYAFFPENAVYLNENALICIFCVFPFYFIGRLIDIEKSYKTFLLLSTICVLIDVFYFFIYAQNNKNMAEVAGEDNMYPAYQLLPHVVFLLWATLKKISIWKVLTFIMGSLFLLSCGTRGPFVCIGFFGIIYFFFFMNFKGAVYVKVAIITLALIFIAYARNIILYLAEVFTGLQLSTRILEKFITGEIGNDSYRSILRDKLYDVLDNGDHFFGLGAFGCRNYDIIYPHILHLDFFCTYGYLMGSILLILLFLFIGYAFWLSRGKETQVFLLFLFSVSIIKLMLSSSFLLEPYFFMLIGACVREVFFNNSPKCFAES